MKANRGGGELGNHHEALKFSSFIFMPERPRDYLVLLTRVSVLTCLIVSVSLVLRATFLSPSARDYSTYGLRFIPQKSLALSPAGSVEPINISHIIFCIAGAADTWIDRSQYISLWWRNSTRGFVWLDKPVKIPQNNSDSRFSIPIRVSDPGWTRYKYSSSRAAVRIARIIWDSYRLNLPNVRWFVMGDDDTVFFTDNLVKVLSKYDHEQMWYIGGNSESVEQDVMHAYDMAFGGGGFAISRPLAARLAAAMDACLQRYFYFYGSDQRIAACVSEMGVPFTEERGFHQMGSSRFPDEDDFEEESFHEEEQVNTPNEQQPAESTEAVIENPESGKRKDVPESSTANEKKAKELKVIVPRSLVWDHFTRTKQDRNKCFCHYCKKSYGCKSKSGTSNLTKHLASCKGYQAFRENKSQKVMKGDGSMQVAKISEPMFREATNEMLVLGELPLSFVDSVAWRHFSSRANLYRPHSRRTASRDIVQMYVKKKALLKNWINSNKQRVSLTTDIWTAPNTGASYMVITAHFIDALWMLKKLIIGFKYVSDHKAATIANTLLECLADWEIKKVFCVTLDNATANTLAMKKFQREFSLVGNEAFVLDGDYMHVRCSAHIINLIVRDGLQELSNNVEAIRNGVAYVRSSHARQRSFELRVDSGKLKRGSLPLDVKTRWNSTYTMLTNALKYKVAFDKMLIEDRLYHDYFQEMDNGNRRVGPPESLDWHAIERFVKFLVIFYNSTLVVSASTSLNAHKCYGEIVTIERNLSFLSNSRDDDLKSRADDMLKKFLKYWDGINNINKMVIIATVFDPTKKLKFAKMCFEKLYGEDSVDSKAMSDSVFYVLDSMYKEYAALYSQTNGASSSQTPKAKQHQATEIPEKMDLADDLGYQRMDMAYKEMVADNPDEVVRRELEVYLTDPVENPKLMRGSEFDVLSWWRVNSFKYPVLAEMAKDVLAMQVSSVASESAFSTSGRILNPNRSCLTHYMIEVLMCTEQWMKQDIKNGTDPTLITTAQLLSEFEMFDQLEKEFGIGDENSHEA